MQSGPFENIFLIVFDVRHGDSQKGNQDHRLVVRS